jgi:hypothetical protein
MSVSIKAVDESQNLRPAATNRIILTADFADENEQKHPRVSR